MIIKWIVSKHGEAILSNPAQLKKEFSKYAANEPKNERLAFGRCIEMGCYSELKKARSENERRQIKVELAGRIQIKTGLNITLCGAALDLLDAAIFGSPVQVQWIQHNTQKPASKTKAKFYRLKTFIKNKKNFRNFLIAGSILFIFLLILGIKNLPVSVNSQNSLGIITDDGIDGLRRISENQEQIALQLEQLRKQIESGQSTAPANQQQRTEQQKLIDKLNNDLLLEILAVKRQGMRDITGKIQVVVVPANYQNNTFRIDNEKLKGPIQEGVFTILNQAKRYNQNITMDWSFSKKITLINESEGIKLFSRYQNSKDYNFTVPVYVIDAIERSFCTRSSDGSNAIMWFKNNNGLHSGATLAHEIFHAFGAEDLYYEEGVVPEEVETYFKTLLGNSIMLGSQNSSVLDPINAWLIGWNKKPEPWYAWFVDKRDNKIHFY